MFKGAENFNQPIGNWDTSRANNMSSLFDNAREFIVNDKNNFT
jgi:surface protein